MFVLPHPQSLHSHMVSRECDEQNSFFFFLFSKHIQKRTNVIADCALSDFEMVDWQMAFQLLAVKVLARALKIAGRMQVKKICIALIYLHSRWLRPKRTLCRARSLSHFTLFSLRFKRYHYDHFHRYSKVGSRPHGQAFIAFVWQKVHKIYIYKAINNIYVCTSKKDWSGLEQEREQK